MLFNLVFSILLCTAYSQGDGSQNICVQQTTCGKCLSLGAECAWCSRESFQAKRCNTKQLLAQSGCSSQYILTASNSMTLLEDEPARDQEENKPVVQLRPQKMAVKLSPNLPLKFNITFTKANNYPVDLYYVMDMSRSMKDDQEKLASLGDKLGSSMRNITTNVRLGLGTFVDKNTAPFSSMVPEHLVNPCTNCVPTFGFKNNLPLTDNTSLFSIEVRNSPISGNLDNLEGGFDAVMQAIVCEQQVGWRNESRRILLYATDGGYHIAGDGKLAGIVAPNDGRCHLNASGYYSEGLRQDYPSISHLAFTIAKKKVNIIFAVEKDMKNNYEALSRMIEGSVVGILEKDSSNIVDLVAENYKKIRDSLELKVESSDDITVTFRTQCDNSVPTWTNGAKCADIKLGSVVTVETTIQVTTCPADTSLWTGHFYIYPFGMNEKLRVEYELTCECECEQEHVDQEHSSLCSKHGTYECASCTCDDGYYGKMCQCDASVLDYDQACKMTSSSKLCEGRGQCEHEDGECNYVCNCNATASDTSVAYYGRYCECSDYNCPWSDGQICGGERGVCECGNCTCKLPWTGPDCSCHHDRLKNCKAANGEVCNGKGVCDCGVCQCNKESPYSGPTCEICRTCEGSGCTVLNEACVECEVHSTGDVTSELCSANCTTINVTIVDTFGETNELKPCHSKPDKDGCYFLFIYDYNTLTLQTLLKKECQPQALHPYIIAAIVVGSILVIGIILIVLWKIIDEMRYRIEMAKFEEDRKKMKWSRNDNPIYRQAESTFRNPTYTGNRISRRIRSWFHTEDRNSGTSQHAN